jgi:hypothetical protein
MGELCGFCRSVVNPGAVVCASCGAYKRRQLRPWMGVLSVFLLAVGFMYHRLLPIPAWILMAGAVVLFFKARHVVWRRRRWPLYYQI